MTDRIRERLSSTFDPLSLSVVDESRLHAGHAGARPGGETHFRVTIISAGFRGKGRLERQRMVYAALSEEMAAGIHALSITAADDLA